MIVTVNDKQIEVESTTTIAALIDSLGYPDRGIAVSLNWSVLPKSDWEQTLSDGARIEVLTAVQGG
ncbi:sulfur carrier protein ThiS [Mycobacterium koreense]|uniref:Thiamine biosynthesis protein ThiS n=1 Tax=Mycolicibacillus koreensis TaxID=1069220 RepID=A0A7I7SHB8_9MYCO|nr:sulfur carrier protein ThiS [Mycolicibacillus koreensis]MCV7248441.1 sulfur carrier protein ThiS [Mycolicibacillus koreensis]ODR11706.1 thiamine biosynthesis protein ThiS [Mycolicibacillus koreensis]OSC26940.1 thiamine biosynthesis protein ThiS [Mycolicibacillus koreensis]BBY55385.1 thiamine biosynthesis protein ThiS [Mycolicibacillus koreensis]